MTQAGPTEDTRSIPMGTTHQHPPDSLSKHTVSKLWYQQNI
jgi:hypothetical protein